MRASILLLAACAPAVPDEPSFQQHVAPILAANCVRCHGTPAIGGAPPGFRLDTYSGHEQPVRGVVQLVDGARTYAGESARRAGSSDDPMPPRFALDDYQIDILARWAELDAPRGAPNPGNRAPFATIANIDLGAAVAIDLFVGDLDPDVVGGALYAQNIAIGALRSGPNHIVATLPSGTYMLEAVLDDGGVEVTLPLGMIEVP